MNSSSVDTSDTTIVTETPRKVKRKFSKKKVEKKVVKKTPKKDSGQGISHLHPDQKIELLDFIEKNKLMPALLDQEKSPFSKGIQYCKNNKCF